MFNADELIEARRLARLERDWKTSDELRDLLDSMNVFVFDTKEGQDVYYLPESYFRNQYKRVETLAMSKRQYVEYRIKQDIRANANFDAWLYSVNKDK